ncbi:MAG TPA: YhjD/YihY/BrkB family envelope integrity protein, partial [Candidatus Deferrimicrobium sp.]|nr:YhjD/YihY/BrkB family envelope integrity protein [Candidatus Deferrimicrobium sp.]
PEFFQDISPDIFEKAGQISAKLKSFGVVGLIFAGFFSFLVLKRIIQFVNDMFHIDIEAHKSEKGFFIRRLTEVGLLAVIGIMMTGSFFFTNFVTSTSAQFTDGKNPSMAVSLETVHFVDTFLIRYLLPFLITFFFFFIIYKWIPSKVVYLKGAFISALISTILCEIVKRIYAYYLVHVSLFGKIRGPIIAIILFGFWMEVSIAIMLYGAKLTYIFDREKNDKIRRSYTVS